LRSFKIQHQSSLWVEALEYQCFAVEGNCCLMRQITALAALFGVAQSFGKRQTNGKQKGDFSGGADGEGRNSLF
jgi:hypothetical protein